MNYKFDDLMNDAKIIFDSVADKTNEAVKYSKTQVERIQLKNSLRERYQTLGRLYYAMSESGSDETSNMCVIIEQIKKLKSSINLAEECVNAKKSKVCGFCESKNDAGDLYCKKCGEKL